MIGNSVAPDADRIYFLSRCTELVRQCVVGSLSESLLGDPFAKRAVEEPPIASKLRAAKPLAHTHTHAKKHSHGKASRKSPVH